MYFQPNVRLTGQHEALSPTLTFEENNPFAEWETVTFVKLVDFTFTQAALHLANILNFWTLY